MDVTDLVQRLLRRWVATAVVVLLAVLAAGVAWSGAGQVHQSSATVVIVPPVLGEAVSDQNPVLNLDDNLAQLATVLAASLAEPDPTERAGLTTDEAGAAGDDTGDATGAATGDQAGETGAGATEGSTGGSTAGGATYTISTLIGDNPSFARLSPQLSLTVTAATPALAEQACAALVAEAGQRLDDLQTEVGAPFQSRASLVTVVAPTPAVAAGGSAVRAAGAVGAGVGVLGLLVVLVGDELLARRRTRRRTTR